MQREFGSDIVPYRVWKDFQNLSGHVRLQVRHWSRRLEIRNLAQPSLSIGVLKETTNSSVRSVDSRAKSLNPKQAIQTIPWKRLNWFKSQNSQFKSEISWLWMRLVDWRVTSIDSRMKSVIQEWNQLIREPNQFFRARSNQFKSQSGWSNHQIQ
jgi:hypothetical protein